ncbi:hypothetical protein R1flu_027028 [Riccia fluitans]|uniref:Reverse transcriptase zinc-binding domain-containing protein n=1 Tax=Riccia fluitans TaxID=41844 RepID=A0ABD1XI45_9MARC
MDGKGEACARYFFATLKAKQTNERMAILRDGENREIRNEELILEQVNKYYTELYAQPAVIEAEKHEQREVLTLVDQLILEEDYCRLMAIPEVEEINETVKALPSEKAPGEDGLPAEVLHELWEDIDEHYINFVQEAWRSRRIGQYNSDNKTKTALVNWESITKLKGNGGLMNGEQSDWAQMVRFFIKHQMQKRSQNQEVKQWTAEEGLLLLPSISTKQSATTNRIIQCWFKFRQYLVLDEQALVLQGSITLKQLQALMQRYRTRRPYNDRVVYPLLKRIGIKVLTNLSDTSGNWIDVVSVLRTQGLQLQQVQTEAIEQCQQWLGNVSIGPQKLEQSPSWRWRTEEASWKGWLRHSQFWHSLCDRAETPDDLTSKWPVGNYRLTWASRWRKLWEIIGPPKVVLWTWKLLRRAFFTGERAATMQVAFDYCCRCKEATETIPHLFFECRKSENRWNLLRDLATRARINLRIPHNLLEFIDEAITAQTTGGLLLFILYSVTTTIWKDRNQMYFNQRSQTTPLRVSLELARAEIEGNFNYKFTPQPDGSRVSRH